MEWLTCSIGEHSGCQSFYLKARKIRAVVDTHQDLIGHDAPVMPRILPDHNEHGAFEGYRKEDVSSKISDPPFANLAQRSGSDEKFILIR